MENNWCLFLYSIFVSAKWYLKYLAITAAFEQIKNPIVLVIVCKGMDHALSSIPDDCYFQHIPQYFLLCLRQETSISVRIHRNCEPASKKFGKISPLWNIMQHKLSYSTLELTVSLYRHRDSLQIQDINLKIQVITLSKEYKQACSNISKSSVYKM